MRSVELLSTELGARKVSCTKILQDRCAIGLAEAKATTDAMLKGSRPMLKLGSDEEARALIAELAVLGVRARFAEIDGYDPEVELAAAVQPLQEVLPSEARETIASLSQHGEWELALSHCLAVLSQRGHLCPGRTHERLSELALEFGLAASRQAGQARPGDA